MLDIVIPGTPRPQGSMALITNKATGIPFGKYSQTTIQHRNAMVDLLRDEWMGADPCLRPVAVRIGFVFAHPKSHYGTGRNAEMLKPGAPKWHYQMPDADKLTRLVCDALSISGVIRDDRQVSLLRASKLWGPWAGTHLEMWGM